jgi:hypothetical protein
MKLSNQLRDKIITDVVEMTTGKAKKALDKRSEALAIQLYNALYSKATRDAMAKLPRGFMPEDRCLKFNLGGMNIQITAEKALRVPYAPQATDDNMGGNYRNSCQRLGNINNEELQAKYLTLHEENEAHKTHVNKVANETRALLYSLHTYPQLVKTWPEGKKFYEKYAPKDGDSQLPALLIADLNKTLGIAA